MAKKPTASQEVQTAANNLALMIAAPVLDATTQAGIVKVHESFAASKKAGANYALDLRNFLVGLPHGNAQQITLTKQAVELAFTDSPDMGVKIERLVRQSVICVCGVPKTAKQAATKGLGIVAFSETLGPDHCGSFTELSSAIRETLAKVTGKEETRGAQTAPKSEPTKTTKIVEPADMPQAKEPTSSKACIALILRSLKILQGFDLKMKDSEKFVLSSAVDTLESLEARAA
jgi:hypothetical protein